MPDSIMADIASYYRSRHDLVLKLVAALDDEQLCRTPNSTTPSIAFHVWHLARWADYMQDMMAGGGASIWEQQGLAERWGWADVALGFAATGLSIDDDVLAALPFPTREVLLDYACTAFARAGQAVDTLTDEQYHRHLDDPHGFDWQGMPIGEIILNWLVHSSRHLGMIECLLGVQGRHGTATR